MKIGLENSKVFITKIIILMLCGIMLVSYSIHSVNASESEVVTVGNYIYNIYQINDTRYVEMHDILNDIDSLIEYNNKTNRLVIDGEEQYFEYTIIVPKLAPKASNQIYASNYTRYGPYTAEFSAVFQTVGLLVGAILAISAVATMVTLVGVSTTAFGAGIQAIYDYFDAISTTVSFAGSVVSGSFSYYQDLQSGTGKARYANRSVKYKFPTTSYKSYSFGTGNWFDTSRPGVLK